MAFLVGPGPAVGATTEVHDSKLNVLGTRRFDRAGNEYIYLEGVASTAKTDFVIYDEAFKTTRLVAAAAAGPVAVALAAVVANKFGWYQNGGKVDGNVAASFADNGLLYATATAGRADDAAVANEQIVGAVGRSAEASNVATVQLTEPWFGVDEAAV